MFIDTLLDRFPAIESIKPILLKQFMSIRTLRPVMPAYRNELALPDILHLAVSFFHTGRCRAQRRLQQFNIRIGRNIQNALRIP